MKSEPEPRAPRRRSARAAQPLARLVVAVGDAGGARALEHRHGVLRVDDRSSDLVHQALERVRSGRLQKAAGHRIGVQVGDRFLAQLREVGLRPLGRAEEPRLLAVPGGVDQRPPRAEALFRKGADRLGLGEQGDHPRHRVGGAVHPGIMVIAAHDPLVGELAARQHGDHVVDRLEAPVERQLQVNAGRPRPHPIRQRQRATPGRRRHRAGERREQRLGIAGGDRQHGNLGQNVGLGERQAHGVLRRADTGGERIAGMKRHVGHRTALHRIARAPAALWPRVALGVAVFGRVREDQTADGAVLRRDLGLDAAPGTAVARQHDLPSDIDAALRELLIVLRQAVVDVDQVGLDVAVDRVDVVAGQLLLLLTRRRIVGERTLVEPGTEAGRRDELERAQLRRREEDVEALDPRLVTPARKEVAHPFGVGAPPLRADMVRPRREALEPGAQLRLRDQAVEPLLALQLGARGFAGEPQKALLDGRRRGDRGRETAEHRGSGEGGVEAGAR